MEGSILTSCELKQKMADTPDESTWTFYINGFICDNNDDDDNNSCFSSGFVSPSLVSDAASSAVAKKLPNWTQEQPKNKTMSKQNSFKKQKTMMIPELEDTASSPVNSPKVSYMNQFMNHDNKQKAKIDVSEVERFGKVFAVERDSKYSDLKKRSTCG